MFGYTQEQMVRIFQNHDDKCDKIRTLAVRIKFPDYHQTFPTDPQGYGIWINGIADKIQLRLELAHWDKAKAWLDALTDEDEILEYRTHGGSRSTSGLLVFQARCIWCC